jgi:hypothetical protein
MIVPPAVSAIYVHVRRDLADSGAPLDVILDDINTRIRSRGGVILADRQLLHEPVNRGWRIHTFFDEETTTPFEHPKREWGGAQRSYFTKLWGLRDPYQYAEQPLQYNRFCFGAYLPRPFLNSTERALAVIEARRDDILYYCQCHSGAVVYTTAHRLICMNCGKLHCVLQEPLRHAFGTGFTEEQWRKLFDDDGVLVDADASIPTVEYQDVYAAKTVWETDIWENMSSHIEFLARGNPDEIARWRAGEARIDDFVEAGWTQARSPPPLLSAQLSADLFGVDLTENAIRSFNSAAEAFGLSRTHGDALRQGVLDLFHALELMLKVRLQQQTGQAFVTRLNNLTVIRMLTTAGVNFTANDLDTIAKLRRLRNRLQHDGARYGYREVRELLAEAFIFIDSFFKKEFGEWIGEIAEQPGWGALLTIPSVRQNAEEEVANQVRHAIAEARCSVEICPDCERLHVVRDGHQAGFCLYCRRVPVRRGDAAGSPKNGLS